jgi:serine protease Do
MWPAIASSLPDFTPLVEQSKPAVVSVEVTREAGGNARTGRSPNNDEMEEFLRRFFGDPRRQGPQSRPQQARGSGFIIDSSGLILTNNHVVENASEVIVRLSDRRELEAEVVGTDPATDIALLRVDESDLPVLPIGNSDALRAGEWVIAIGSPFNFDYTVTSGIVSAKGRSFPGQQYVPFIQTDVPINPGNSGGPLINMAGEVVGINSQIFSSSGGYMGLSFSIPVDVAMDVVGQLRDKQRVSRGYLGVVVEDVTASVARFWGLERATGALVSQVVDDSPADVAGIQAGDIILRVGGRGIERQSALPPAVGMIRPGTSVNVEVLRDRERETLEVTIQELDADNPLASGSSTSSEPKAENTLGLVVDDLDLETARRLGVDGGVLVQRVLGTAASRAGLREGDVVLMLGSTRVEDAEHFERLIARNADAESIPLLVQRGEVRRYLVIERN